MKKISSKVSREEFIRVRLVGEKDAEPLLAQSGIISSLVRAEGIVEVPEEAEGLKQGAEVEVQLLQAHRG